MKERKIICEKQIPPIEERLEEFGDWEIKSAFDSEGYITIILEREVEDE